MTMMTVQSIWNNMKTEFIGEKDNFTKLLKQNKNKRLDHHQYNYFIMGAKDNQYNYFIMGEKKDNFTKLLKQNKRLDHQYSCSVDWKRENYFMEDTNSVIKKHKEMDNDNKLVSETNLSILTETNLSVSTCGNCIR